MIQLNGIETKKLEKCRSQGRAK